MHEGSGWHILAQPKEYILQGAELFYKDNGLPLEKMVTGGYQVAFQLAGTSQSDASMEGDVNMVNQN